jgi:hypothetical protein
MTIQFQAIPKFPPHPVHPDRRCENCSHWLQSEKKRVAAVNGAGMIPVAELLKQGIHAPAECKATISFCTKIPVWAQVTDDHWCDNWWSDKHPIF